MADNTYIKLEHTNTLTSVVVANGTVNTGMTVLRDGTHLGAAVENPMFSRTIDSLGVRVTGQSTDAREQRLNILFESTSNLGLQTLLDSVYRMTRNITDKGGGFLYFRSANGSSTAITRYRIAAMKMADPVDLGDYEGLWRATVALTLIVDPYGFGPDYTISDDFSTDTIGVGGKYNIGGADWTKTSANTSHLGSGSGSISGGTFNCTNTNAATSYTHTGTAHTYGDTCITSKVVFTTRSNNAFAGHVFAYVDSNNYLFSEIIDDGVNTIIKLKKVVGGIESALATPISVNCSARLTSGGTQWLRTRIEGNVVYVENWLTAPTPGGTPTDSGSSVLSSAEIALFGSANNRVGMIFFGAGLTTIAFDDFDCSPCVYRNWNFPDVIPLKESWGGTHDARGSIAYTAVTTIPAWIMYSWWPKPQAHNYVWNGGGEVVGNVASTAYGWSGTATGSITAAGTITRDTTAANIRTGSACLNIVCAGGVANQGAVFPVYRRLKKGVTYTFSAYLKATAGTQTAQIGFGSSAGTAGLFATSTAVALNTGYVLHTATLTPTADIDTAYFCVRVTTTTAQTLQMDDVQVYEGTTAPTFAHGGMGPGVHSAASYDAAKASIATDGTYFAVTASATYRLGFGLQGTGAMGTTANAEFFVDPALFSPDDFSGTEVDVGVLIRCNVASTQTSLACTLSYANEGGTAYGARKYSEFRSAGKTLKLPSAGTATRSYYVGTVTLNVDQVNRGRVKLRLAFANSGAATGTFGFDQIVLYPIRKSARSQSGVLVANYAPFLGALQSTKTINYDLSGSTANDTSTTTSNPEKDDGIGGSRILFSPTDSLELLVYPIDLMLDTQDSVSTSNTLSYTGCINVNATPQVHLLRQT